MFGYDISVSKFFRALLSWQYIMSRRCLFQPMFISALLELNLHPVISGILSHSVATILQYVWRLNYLILSPKREFFLIYKKISWEYGPIALSPNTPGFTPKDGMLRSYIRRNG